MQEPASCCFRLPRAGLKPCPDCGGSGPHRRSPACRQGHRAPPGGGSREGEVCPTQVCPSPGPWPALGTLALSHRPRGGGRHTWLWVGGLAALNSWAGIADGRNGGQHQRAQPAPGSWASQTAETMKAPHVLDPRLLIGGCSPRGRRAFPVVLCPQNKEAGTRHPLKRGSDSPCGAGRMGQRRARLSSGTNGTGHQGAASAHRLPALSLQRDGSPADLPAGSGQRGLAWALLF